MSLGYGLCCIDSTVCIYACEGPEYMSSDISSHQLIDYTTYLHVYLHVYLLLRIYKHYTELYMNVCYSLRVRFFSARAPQGKSRRAFIASFPLVALR